MVARQKKRSSKNNRRGAMRTAAAPRSKRGRKPQSDLTKEERDSLVCHYFSKGFVPKDIRGLLQKEHAVTINREAPWLILARACQKSRFQYQAPNEERLANRIREKYPDLSLRSMVEVVETAVIDDVAYRGAQKLLELVQGLPASVAGGVVHVGFAGGNTMRLVANKFSHLLEDPKPRLPSEIVFHALVAGWDIGNPTTDPNGFASYFNRPGLHIEPKFVALHAPAIVTSKLKGLLLEDDFAGIKAAKERAADLDIVVTSASDWSLDHNDHSAFFQCVERNRKCLDTLRKYDFQGDIAWLPIGASGPIPLTEMPFHPMTLLDPDELSSMVRKRKDVLLVLGPCNFPKCNRPRDRILKTILSLRPSLISHLVLDSRTARALLVQF